MKCPRDWPPVAGRTWTRRLRSIRGRLALGDGNSSVAQSKLDSCGCVASLSGFLAGLAFALSFVLSSAAFAAGCPKTITDCCSITTTGSFTVANPLTAGPSLTECIKIAAPNVELFIAGNSITGPSASSTSLKFGIHILGTAPGALVIGGNSAISHSAGEY